MVNARSASAGISAAADRGGYGERRKSRRACDLRQPAQRLLQRRAGAHAAEAGAARHVVPAGAAIIIVSPEYNWSIPGPLKNAIDWVSRMKDQPFKDKPVAVQSAAGGLLGGSRMQYHLRQSLTSIDAVLFGRTEVIVAFAPQKFDEKTIELKDQTAIDLIKQQLAGFEKYIRRHVPG